MCNSTELTKLCSIICIALMFIIPLSYLMLYIKKAQKKKKKNRNYLKAFLIACIMFVILFLIKIAISLTGDSCMNCYINNKCSTSENKKEEVTTTTVKSTSVSTTKETTTTTVSSTTQTTTKASNNSKLSYDKVKEIDGEKKEVGVTTKGYKIYEINGITYIDGILIANKTYSLPNDYEPTDTYKSAIGKTNTCNDCINNTVYKAWKQMSADAASVGINLYIGSGYRPYSTQKAIYNRYVARDGQTKADTYSARPGSSEHQTALCFDVCGTNLSSDKCISSAFNNTNEAKWLDNNAYLYGFIIRYPNGKTDETGYKYESWHLRYVGAELAKKLYNNGDWITVESYYGITSEYSN